MIAFHISKVKTIKGYRGYSLGLTSDVFSLT